MYCTLYNLHCTGSCGLGSYFFVGNMLIFMYSIVQQSIKLYKNIFPLNYTLCTYFKVKTLFPTKQHLKTVLRATDILASSKKIRNTNCTTLYMYSTW